MKTLEYHTTDKTSWPAGLWQSEPDKKQWQDSATGLPCLIVRRLAGALCGYVGVNAQHPWYGIDYSGCTEQPCCALSHCDHSPELLIDVHGGLTFADGCNVEACEQTSICHKPEPGETDKVWWFGFDCAHWGDFSPAQLCWQQYTTFGCDFSDRREYRDFAYVEKEVARLAAQLVLCPTLVSSLG